MKWIKLECGGYVDLEKAIGVTLQPDEHHSRGEIRFPTTMVLIGVYDSTRISKLLDLEIAKENSSPGEGQPISPA